MDAHFFEFNHRLDPLTAVTLLHGTATRDISFGYTVIKYGDPSTAGGVGWTVTPQDGLDGSDFTGGRPHGRIHITGASGAAQFTLKAGAHVDHDAKFDVMLQAPSAGDVLGSYTDITVRLLHVTNHADQAIGGVGHDQLSTFGGADLVKGRAGYDWLDGGTGNDTLFGGTGDDQLIGGAGRDHLRGGAGNDTLYGDYGGTSGTDTLVGGAGDDLLIGGARADRLTGGAGADHFAFYASSESAGTARDLITDFHHAQGDWIDLAFDADTGTAGVQSFADVGSLIGHHGFDGTAGEVRYHYLARLDVTRVLADTTGDGNADFALDLAGKQALHLADLWGHLG